MSEELLEGVLLASRDAFEERKVEHLGRLYAGIAFDSSVSRAHGNYLIALAQRLTYRQLALMAVIWEGDALPMVNAGRTEEPTKHVIFSDELGVEVDELERLAMVSRGEPGGTFKRGGVTATNASGGTIDRLTLASLGKRVYELMALGEIGPEGRREVLDALGLGWSMG